MLDSGSGFDSLLASLSAIGADTLLPLPGVDDPTTPADYVRQCLALMGERGVPFEAAWSSTINRIQAPQGPGGSTDPIVRELVLEQRALLEEDRPLWQAAYEGRPLTSRERAVRTVAAWRRLEAGDAPRGPKIAA